MAHYYTVRIGFLVNPIAGMGGRVGLKGTDGKAAEARKRGAEPVAGERAILCAKALKDAAGSLDILTCAHTMGQDHLDGMEHKVVYECSESTSAQDTKSACEAFEAEGAKLILFTGGDGTARDVYSAVEDRIPVIGVPAGVKMHSSVFAVNPAAAGKLALAYAQGEAGLHDAEVVDVDEDAYRRNELKTRVYGVMKVPYIRQLVQDAKAIYSSGDDEQAKEGIAEFASEFMSDGSAYVVGAGSTTKAIGDRLGIDKTLLGVDVVKDGKLIIKDAGEKELLKVLEEEDKVKVIVSPIGAQGFVFGRGTQQISPAVLAKAGVKNIIYVATPQKLNSVPHLLVDTGDPLLDSEIAGYRSVVIGYMLSQRKDIVDLGKK